MENGEDIIFGDQIKPTSFYSNEQEKTKLNWFCYELALSFDLAIGSKLGKKLEICPNRCVTERDKYCTMFDEGF